MILDDVDFEDLNKISLGKSFEVHGITREQRIEWHLEHREACGCRPPPEGLVEELDQRKARARKWLEKNGIELEEMEDWAGMRIDDWTDRELDDVRGEAQRIIADRKER